MIVWVCVKHGTEHCECDTPTRLPVLRSQVETDDGRGDVPRSPGRDLAAVSRAAAAAAVVFGAALLTGIIVPAPLVAAGVFLSFGAFMLLGLLTERAIAFLVGRSKPVLPPPQLIAGPFITWLGAIGAALSVAIWLGLFPLALPFVVPASLSAALGLAPLLAWLLLVLVGVLIWSGGLVVYATRLRRSDP